MGNLVGPSRSKATPPPAAVRPPKRPTPRPSPTSPIHFGVAGQAFGLPLAYFEVPRPTLSPNPDPGQFDATKWVDSHGPAESQEFHASLRCNIITDPSARATKLIEIYEELTAAIKVKYGSAPEGFDVSPLPETWEGMAPSSCPPKQKFGDARDILEVDFYRELTDPRTAEAHPTPALAPLASTVAFANALQMRQQAWEAGVDFDYFQSTKRAYKLATGRGDFEPTLGSAMLDMDFPGYLSSQDFTDFRRAHAPEWYTRVPVGAGIAVAGGKDPAPGRLVTPRPFEIPKTLIGLANPAAKKYLALQPNGIGAGVDAGSQSGLKPQQSGTVISGPGNNLAADLKVDESYKVKGGSGNLALNLGGLINQRSAAAKKARFDLGIAGYGFAEAKAPPPLPVPETPELPQRGHLPPTPNTVMDLSEPSVPEPGPPPSTIPGTAIIPEQPDVLIAPEKRIAPLRTEWGVGGQIGAAGFNVAAQFARRTTPSGLEMNQFRWAARYSRAFGEHNVTFSAGHDRWRYSVDSTAGGDQHTARLGDESGTVHRGRAAAALKLALNDDLNLALGGVVAVLWKNGEFRGLGEAGGSVGIEGPVADSGSFNVSAAYARRRFDSVGSTQTVWINGLQLKLLIDAGDGAPWFIRGGYMMLDAAWADQHLGPLDTIDLPASDEIKPGAAGVTLIGGLLFMLQPPKKKKKKRG